MGQDTMSTIAIALEERALNDQWFSERSLYPNIDYWAAIVFHTLGFPQDMFPVWMMIPRVAGFIAHWQESLDDPEYKIYRPRQIYTGITLRKYEKVTQPPTMSPSLSTQDYLKSDPQAALRRTTADPRSLPEILGAISKTETEIAALRSELLSEAQASAQIDNSGPMASTNALLSISWITQQFTKTKSVSDVTSVNSPVSFEMISLLIVGCRNWINFKRSSRS
jgi:citrate synthase